MRLVRSWAGALLLTVCVMVPTQTVAVAAEPVDLELVLAVDGSASISGGVMAFQLRGHAAALRDPAVASAIAAGPHRAIAVMLLRYAGPGEVEMLLPWTRLGTAQDLARFADRLEAVPASEGGSTALGSAIEAAVPLFPANGFDGTRKVLDLVGNGFSNAGPPVEPARDAAVAAGITVNGLAILDEYEWLDAYYAQSVIGGPGAFVRTAVSRESFAEAILYKLIDEIVQAPSTPPGRRLARSSVPIRRIESFRDNCHSRACAGTNHGGRG